MLSHLQEVLKFKRTFIFNLITLVLTPDTKHTKLVAFDNERSCNCIQSYLFKRLLQPAQKWVLIG